MSSDSCPTHDMLITYVRGTLSEDLAEHIEEHLDTCPKCETTVEELERQSDSLVDRLRQPVADDEYQRESQCQHAVAQAEAIAESSFGAAAPSARSPSSEQSGLGSIREYQLLEKLGEGGMGAVYKAHHTKLKRVVALKVLPPQRTQDDGAVARFEREMEAVGKLDHPNIVRALDAGEFEGKHYLVMEYVEGADLSKLVQCCGPLPIADACEIARQAALGLQYAHDRGLVHRDIKPSNLMLAISGQQSAVSDGEAAPESAIANRQSAIVKILDLGLALLRPEQVEGAEELTANGQMMGTADYMAPEQTTDSHKVDIRADIYSLGCTLYKLLSGHAPFGGPDYHGAMKKMMAHVVEEIPPIRERRDEVSEGLAATLDRMLAKEPGERFSSPSEVAAALEPFAADCDLAGLLGKAETESSETVKPDKPSTDTQPSVMSAVTDTRPSGPAEPQPIPATFWMRPRWLAIAAAVAGIVLLGFVLTITGRHGTLVVEAEDENVQVVVKRGGEEIEIVDADSNWTIRLKEGEYDIQLRGGDDRVQVDRDTVTVRRGEKTRVKVVLKRPAPTSTPPEPADTPPAKEPPERPLAWKPGKPAPRPKVVPINIEPEPLDLKPGDPLSQMALVTNPAPINGVRSWTMAPYGHSGPVHALAFNPAGRLLAAGGADGVIRLWDVDARRLARALVGHEGEVRSLAWSPDGKILASGDGTGIVRLWDADSGQVLREIEGPSVGNPGWTRVDALAWSPTGQMLAVSNQIWDLESGQPLHTLGNGPGGYSRSVAWSPDGKILAVVGGVGELGLFDAESGQLLRKLLEGGGGAKYVAWSPDGNILASGGTPARLWDAKSGAVLREFEDGTVAWSPDAATLVSCNPGVTFNLVFLDVATGQTLREIETQSITRCLALSPDGKTVASSRDDGRVELWDAKSGKRLDHFAGNAVAMSIPPHAKTAWSPDSRNLALAESSSDSGRPILQIYNVESGQLRALGEDRSGVEGSLFPESWSPDGKMLVSRSAVHPYTAVLLWNVESGRVVKTLDHTGLISTSAWSPDGTILAVGTRGDERAVSLFDVKSGQVIHDLRHPEGEIGQVAWSPQGKTIATLRVYGSVRLWDVESGQLVRTLTLPDPSWHIMCLAWSPNDKTLASGCDDGKLRLWEAESGRVVETLEHDAPVRRVAWLPDAKTLVSLSDTLRIWNLEAARPLAATFRGPRPGSFSRDGRLLASPEVNTVRLWETVTGQARGTIVLLRNNQYLTVSPAGHYRGTEGVQPRLIYVVQTDRGQETLTPEEFSEKYGWKNEPSKVTPGAAREAETSAIKKTPERPLGWKPGKPIPKPKPVPTKIEPEPLDLEPGKPMSEMALVTNPAPIKGVRSWTIETRGHRAGAAAAWNPDGSLLATYSDDGAIRLWNPVTGGLVKTLLGHDLQVWCAAWSPDGKFLASGGWDGTIRFWDTESGLVLRTIRTHSSRAYEGHSAPVLSLAWSPDGRLLASGCTDGSIQLWDVSSGEVFFHSFDAHADSSVWHLAWSPDGEKLASWGQNGTVKVWVVGSADCQLGHTWQAGCSPCAALDWSPDGRILATSGGQSYGLWNTESGKRWEPFRPFGKWAANDGFHRFAWSPIGETAITVYGRDLKHWQIETGEMLYEELLPEMVGLSGCGYLVRHLSCSPGGDLLALSYWESGEGLVELRDANSGSRLHLLPRCRVQSCLYTGRPTRCVPPCFSSEGDVLATAHLDGTVQLWETRSGKPLRALETDPGISDMAFSPDSDILAIGIRGPNHKLQLWDIRSGELQREIPTGLSGLAWSSDGKSLTVTGVYGAPVQIYDAESATLRKTFSIDMGVPFGPVAWSPDGQTLAAALSATPGGENICVFDVESGRLRCKLSGKGVPYKLRWHDETTLLSYELQCNSARDPRLTCTFDVKSEKLLSAVPDSVDAISPDGELRVTAQDGMIRLERADDGKVINTIVPLRDLQHVAISPDGHYRGSPGVAKELVYVVQTDKGQETLTPDEFSRRYGWSNDPNRVKVDLGDSSAPKPR